jgi:flavodoxin
VKRTLIIYDTTFGNTKRLAESIATGIREAGEIECVLKSIKEFTQDEIPTYDGLLFGCPIHAFQATRGIRGAVKKAAKAGLDGKLIAAFQTHQVDAHKKTAVGKIESMIEKRAPGALLYTPGFAGLVDGYQGPLNADEPPRAKEFGLAYGQRLNAL